MARGAFPSMTALLGLLAVAGYQNRDKIAEMLANRGASDATPTGGAARRGPEGASGLDGLLGGFLGGQGLDRLLGGGLSELSDRFRRNDQAETMDSWVGAGPSRGVGPGELEKALGPETLDELTEHTGLSREEILARLSRELPDAVDRYTPQGRLPPQAG